MTQNSFRILLCADAGFFHFLPSLEENILKRQGEYPVIYDLGMTPAQVACLKSEVIKLTPPDRYKLQASSGAIKATHKPRCIQHFLENYAQDVLYIDADVVVLETIYSDEFLGGDICVTPRHPIELRSPSPFLNGTLNSGVIFFKNTPAVQKVVKLWEAECGIDDKSDQMALSDVLEDADIKAGPGVGYAHGLTIQKLPAAIYNDVSCSTGKL
ncbi:putative nucleotide-diphospho-sugar transferase [Pseudorhodobacter aquimaris]|uniref:putative nucleotide-diphospho-sugar transferase n=1 Tax=Pseudorhodobacter aquimaris TaxID=687412 RepID=UPI00067BD889|nr:putative nucleotide-diphospho-sugar transferase [Pseudorhodobacter aquimaris]